MVKLSRSFETQSLALDAPPGLHHTPLHTVLLTRYSAEHPIITRGHCYRGTSEEEEERLVIGSLMHSGTLYQFLILIGGKGVE